MAKFLALYFCPELDRYATVATVIASSLEEVFALMNGQGDPTVVAERVTWTGGRVRRSMSVGDLIVSPRTERQSHQRAWYVCESGFQRADPAEGAYPRYVPVVEQLLRERGDAAGKEAADLLMMGMGGMSGSGLRQHSSEIADMLAQIERAWEVDEGCPRCSNYVDCGHHATTVRSDKTEGAFFLCDVCATTWDANEAGWAAYRARLVIEGRVDLLA